MSRSGGLPDRELEKLQPTHSESREDRWEILKEEWRMRAIYHGQADDA
jgi:hypothetical protein